VVVAYVLGTQRDPQNLQRQQQTLRDAGCIVTETAARAALASAAVAARDPDVVSRSL
jgi:FdrA protein